MGIFGFGEKPKGEELQKLEALHTNKKAADALRRQMEAIWLTNIGFAEGKQWQSYANDILRYRRIEIAPPSSKIKLVDNRVLVLRRQTHASLTANSSTHVAIAATNDEEDIQAAELATRWIRSFEAQNDERRKRFYEWGWKMDTGVVFRLNGWNPDADGVGVDQQPMPGAGEIESKTYNPFQVWLSPWVSTEGENPWFIISEVKSTDEVNDLFKPSRKVQSEESAGAMASLDNLLSGIVTGSSGGVEKRKDSVILNFAYHAPTPKKPGGAYFIFTENNLLHEGDLPDGFLGLVAKHWYPMPGSVYSMSYTGPLIDAQKELNTIKSQLITLKNNQLAGHVIMQGSGEVTQDWARDDEGKKTAQKIIRIPIGTQSWKLMDYSLQATEAERLIERMWEDMKMAGLQQDQDLGIAGSTQTAREALLLNEKSQTGLTLFRQSEDWDNAAIMEQCLQLAKENYIVPRALKEVGADQIANVEAFFGADFLNTTDVRPKPTPMISETMKAAMIMDLADKGLFLTSGSPVDRADRVTVLLSSGIPDIREDIEKRYGKSIDDIYQEAIAFRELTDMATAAQMQGAIQQMQTASEQPAPEQSMVA